MPTLFDAPQAQLDENRLGAIRTSNSNDQTSPAFLKTRDTAARHSYGAQDPHVDYAAWVGA
jgi:hypothetical protein